MRYLTLGIHYPKPEHAEDILAAVRHVADAARQRAGLVDTGAWLDAMENRIILMSLWESEEDAALTRPVSRPLIMESPWSEWERQPSKNFLQLTRAV